MRNRFLEFHHLYFGIVEVLLSVAFMWVWPHPWLAAFFGIKGVVLIIDDLVQHFIQRFIDPDYHSWVHRLYVWMFGWLHRWIVERWRAR